MNDILQSVQSRVFSYFGYDEAAHRFIEFYSNKEEDTKKNKYTGIYTEKYYSY